MAKAGEPRGKAVILTERFRKCIIEQVILKLTLFNKKKFIKIEKK